MNGLLDPRWQLVKKRLRKVDEIIAISSVKGGVGKSTIAALLSLALAEKYDVGLLDCDFTNPIQPTLLGIRKPPEEDFGIIPPEVSGVKVMSLGLWDVPSVLRGKFVKDALLELLTITRFGKLDYLVLDMPPGMADVFLDVESVLKPKHILVTTPRSFIIQCVERMEKTLGSVLGWIVNMYSGEQIGKKVLGYVSYDKSLDGAVGNVQELKKCKAYEEIRDVVNTGVI